MEARKISVSKKGFRLKLAMIRKGLSSMSQPSFAQQSAFLIALRAKARNAGSLQVKARSGIRLKG
jgi:hypothetical protein